MKRFIRSRSRAQPAAVPPPAPIVMRRAAHSVGVNGRVDYNFDERMLDQAVNGTLPRPGAVERADMILMGHRRAMATCREGSCTCVCHCHLGDAACPMDKPNYRQINTAHKRSYPK